MKCHAFEPITNAEARVLILGTLPSVESLKRCQYYANPTNRFWRIMDELIGVSPDAYDDRQQRLTASGISLWDVCQSAERSGSLDSRIVMSTVVPNDFDSFLQGHRQVRLICFNGRTAEKIFKRKVTADLSRIRCELLPSSSAAHAIKHAQKVSHWRKVIGSEIAVK